MNTTSPIALHFDVKGGLRGKELIDELKRMIDAEQFSMMQSFDNGRRFLSPHHPWQTQLQNISVFEADEYGLDEASYQRLCTVASLGIEVTVVGVTAEAELSVSRTYTIEVPDGNGGMFLVHDICDYQLTNSLNDLHE